MHAEQLTNQKSSFCDGGVIFVLLHTFQVFQSLDPEVGSDIISNTYDLAGHTSGTNYKNVKQSNQPTFTNLVTTTFTLPHKKFSLHWSLIVDDFGCVLYH